MTYLWQWNCLPYLQFGNISAETPPPTQLTLPILHSLSTQHNKYQQLTVLGQSDTFGSSSIGTWKPWIVYTVAYTKQQTVTNWRLRCASGQDDDEVWPIEIINVTGGILSDVALPLSDTLSTFIYNCRITLTRRHLQSASGIVIGWRILFHDNFTI